MYPYLLQISLQIIILLIVNHSTQKSKTPTRPAPPKIPKPPTVDKKMIAKPKISTMEQRDRSLTVMIPRAKYHPAAPNSSMDIEYDRRSASVCSTTEAKLLNYLDASPSTSKVSMALLGMKKKLFIKSVFYSECATKKENLTIIV